MYTRKWTRMNYFDSLKMFKKYGLMDNYQPWQRAFHLFPIQQYERELMDPSKIEESKEIKQQKKQDQKLIRKLLSKYPDLKYEPVNQIQEGAPLQHKNYVLKFINKQKQLIENGFNEDIAFQKTENIFQDRIQNKIDSLQITEGLASSNRARSFMNYYQQQGEYESRLKVLRMQRDLVKYEQSVKEFKDEMDNIDIDQDETILNQQQSEQKQDNSDIYERVLYNIVNDDKQAKKYKDRRREDYQEQQEQAQQFLEKTKNIFQKYYERAAYADRLDNLTDQEIKTQIRDSPKKMKKRTKQLLQKLEKLGVALDQNGEIDLSSVPYSNLRKQLQNNPVIKIALMQKELDFEFAHKEHLRSKAQDLKKRLEAVDSEYQSVQQDKMEYLQDLQAKQQNQQNIGEDESMSTNNNNLDQLSMEFDYQAVKQELKEQSKRQLSEQQDGSRQSQQQQENQLNISEQQADIEKLQNDFLQASQITLDSAQHSTYKLFETYEERQLRLQAKYLQQKLQDVQDEQFEDEELGLEDPNIDIMRMAEQKQREQLEEAISNFRRLKFRMEQQNLKNAKELLFQEHDVFDYNDILIDQDVPYEQLESYLNLPKEKRVQNEADEVMEMKIRELITPKDVHEDLVEQYGKYYEHSLRPSDSFEASYDSLLKTKKDQSLSVEANRLKNEQEMNLINFQEEVDVGGSRKSKDKSKKEDKKQLLEFLKKANSKKQTVGKTTRKLTEIRKEKKLGKSSKKK